jgi:beta-N-acetylhexosaminidase
VNARQTPIGPVHVAVGGFALDASDRERLLHPLVGGVVLFAANYGDRAQLARLCGEIHALREPCLTISVDHEGGRVQRFREGFTALPPMRRIGELWESRPDEARRLAWACGLTMAIELRCAGVDLSLAPVLDVDHGASSIIGDRAFHRDPEVIAVLAGALIEGLREGGMGAIGKHYPGHGFIAADSHLELPVDDRGLEALEGCDLVPFQRLAARLSGVMPAHVLYPRVDSTPAGFSTVWIRDILRGRLKFQGLVFSDDLGMAGAAGAGGLAERARAAFSAGCDLVLACTPQGADEVLAGLDYVTPASTLRRLAALGNPGLTQLTEPQAAHPEYRSALQTVLQISA